MKTIVTYTIRHNEAEGWVELVKDNAKPYLAARLGLPTPQTVAELLRAMAEDATRQADALTETETT